MKNFKNYTILALILALGAGYLFHDRKVKDLQSDILDLKTEKKREIQVVRDSAFTRIKELTSKSTARFDSLLNIKQEIKYVPYEKLRYVDRTLDDALDVISDYNYSGTERPNN